MAVYFEFTDDIFIDRVKICVDVMYKVLDRDDRDNQGLYKQAFTNYLDYRGMGMVLKHRVEKGDIFLIDVFLEDVNTLIKACCEAVSCEEKEDGTYRVRLEFIIIKDSYRHFWEEYICSKIETQAV